MSDTPPPRVAAPGKRISIALAVAVHVVLAAILIYGVHWQTKMKDVVEVELVRPTAAPAPVARPQPTPAPPTREEPKPEPKPQPKPEPKPEPKPIVKPEPRPLPPAKPDIALKDKEKPKPPVKEEPKPKPFDPFAGQLAAEEKQLVTNKQIADEERQLDRQRAAQATAARDKAMGDYADRIRSKIKGNIVLPPELKGNPIAKFDVVQLPSGEVISAKLVRSSGHAGYDAAVERAILKSSPLPRPDNPGLFERNLDLTFCPFPKDDGKCS